jgi:hypothetical protein
LLIDMLPDSATPASRIGYGQEFFLIFSDRALDTFLYVLLQFQLAQTTPRKTTHTSIRVEAHKIPHKSSKIL